MCAHVEQRVAIVSCSYLCVHPFLGSYMYCKIDPEHYGWTNVYGTHILDLHNYEKAPFVRACILVDLSSFISLISFSKWLELHACQS